MTGKNRAEEAAIARAREMLHAPPDTLDAVVGRLADLHRQAQAQTSNRRIAAAASVLLWVTLIPAVLTIGGVTAAMLGCVLALGLILAAGAWLGAKVLDAQTGVGVDYQHLRALLSDELDPQPLDSRPVSPSDSTDPATDAAIAREFALRNRLADRRHVGRIAAGTFLAAGAATVLLISVRASHAVAGLALTVALCAFVAWVVLQAQEWSLQRELDRTTDARYRDIFKRHGLG